MANDDHVRIVKEGAGAIAKWHQEHPDERLDLREADLIGSDLRKADLSGAKLTGADLTGADLSKAILLDAELGDLLGRAIHHPPGFNPMIRRDRFRAFSGANLSSANLNGAFLSHTRLCGAILDRAKLRRAILQYTDLSRAKLGNADFEEAAFLHTYLCDVDLSLANNLELATHGGPSTIGVDTLYRSQGKIPDVFLRGCGVPENLITYLPSLTNQAIEFFSCFISYSHADKSFARRLHDALQGRGIRCWLDEHQILPGDDIYAHVDRGIRLWDKVLLCASEHSLNSPWVDREVDTAIEKEMRIRKDRGKQALAIVPLNLDGSLFEWNGSHAATLRKRLAPDFTGWESDNDKFEQQFENVVKALRADDGGRESPPESKL